jgi:hypothetical protein
MKDTLQNIIQYTQGLGNIDLIKVTGTQTMTTVNAVSEDKSVVVTGTLVQPNPEFEGVFGMPNLGKLKTILGFDDYDETSSISITRKDRDGVQTPDTIHFETKDKTFVNDYRLMAKSIVEEKIKDIKFKGAAWNVDFEPTVASILRLKKQASANSEEKNFATKVENGDLKIYFGDVSTHSGNFVFQAGITGTLTKNWYWPVQEVLAILSLPGDKTFRISDQGAAEITVDSGLAVYQYLLPAQQK